MVLIWYYIMVWPILFLSLCLTVAHVSTADIAVSYAVDGDGYDATGGSSFENNMKQIDLTAATGIALGRGFEGGGQRHFSSVADMWKEELVKDGGNNLYDPEKGWYGRTRRFWANEEPTLDGVLGGTAAQTHAVDIRESKRFLLNLEKKGIRPGAGRALDCGCGIGRVSENLLVKRFKTIDIIEPSPKMLEAAVKMLSEKNKLGTVFDTSLELADLPTEPTYDFIVVQWVSMYLTDNDLVAFLKKCKKALKPSQHVPTTEGENGQNRRTSIIFLKENVMHGDTFLLGKQDLAINRCDSHYKAIFKLAGLELVDEAPQMNWPAQLVPLRMYALK